MVLVSVAGMATAIFCLMLVRFHPANRDSLRKAWVLSLATLNPISLPFYIAYHVLRLIHWLTSHTIRLVQLAYKNRVTISRELIEESMILGMIIWHILRAIGRFWKNFFLFIHSDERLICAFGAAFGTASGYFAGNALIGAITGLMAGIASYEIFAKRLCKNAIAAYLQQRAPVPVPVEK